MNYDNKSQVLEEMPEWVERALLLGCRKRLKKIKQRERRDAFALYWQVTRENPGYAVASVLIITFVLLLSFPTEAPKLEFQVLRAVGVAIGGEPVSVGQVLQDNDMIEIAPEGVAVFRITDSSDLRLQGPAVVVYRIEREGSVFILDHGWIAVRSNGGGKGQLVWKTGNAEYTMVGTHADLRVTKNTETLRVLEGEFQVRAASRTVDVGPGGVAETGAKGLSLRKLTGQERLEMDKLFEVLGSIRSVRVERYILRDGREIVGFGGMEENGKTVIETVSGENVEVDSNDVLDISPF